MPAPGFRVGLCLAALGAAAGINTVDGPGNSGVIAPDAPASAPQLPLKIPLTPLQSGMAGMPPVFSAQVTAGHSGPLHLLVDTGSSVVVISSAGGPDGSSSFIARDSEVTIEYEGGSVVGAARTDQFCFADAGPVCLANFPFLAADQAGGGITTLGVDGVLGLAPRPGAEKYGVAALDETLADGLATAANAPRMFGLFVSPGEMFGQSELSLGGHDPSKIAEGEQLAFVDLASPPAGRWEVPLAGASLVPAGGGEAKSFSPCGGRSDCRVLIDSGTAQIEAEPGLLNAFASAMPDTSDCSGSGVGHLPDLHLTFGNGDGSTVKLGPEDYMSHLGGSCALGVNAISEHILAKHNNTVLVLGQRFLQKVYTVFDQDGGRIGFARSAAASSHTANEEAAEEQNDKDGASLAGFLASPSGQSAGLP